VAAGIPIGVHLPVLAAVILLTSFPVLRWLPDAGRSQARESSVTARPARAGLVVLLCLIAGAVFLAEGIAIEWSALYLRGSIGTDAGTASLGVVAFSAGMVGSRFTGDRLAARIDQATIIRVGGSVAAFALASALIIGGAVPAIVALGVAGLGLGPIVPLVFRAAETVGIREGRTALPVVVTAGYAGSIVGPLVVGFIADLVSLRAAFTLPVAACAVAAIASGAARTHPVAT
jgi:fucose permease